jgi:hypothetical protein
MNKLKVPGPDAFRAVAEYLAAQYTVVTYVPCTADLQRA